MNKNFELEKAEDILHRCFYEFNMKIKYKLQEVFYGQR
jgi:hypothetical protein